MNNKLWDLNYRSRYDLWLNNNFEENDLMKEKIRLFLLVKPKLDIEKTNKKEIIIKYQKWQNKLNKNFWPKCNKKWNLEENALRLINYIEDVNKSKDPVMCRYRIQQYCREQFIFNCNYIDDINLLEFYITHPYFGYCYEYESNVTGGLISSTNTGSTSRIDSTIKEGLKNLIEKNHFKSFKILFKYFYNPKKIKSICYLRILESYISFLNTSLYFNMYHKKSKDKFLSFLENQKNFEII